MNDIEAYMIKLGSQARAASRQIGKATTAQKNHALLAIADAIDGGREQLLSANQLDLEEGREKPLESALLDRLELTEARIDSMIDGLRQVKALDDPVGEITRFKSSGVQWIVSVGMVSEGTDIPRLQVCCHLSHVKTELYFRQVLGRILRVSSAMNQEAWLYTIAERKLICFAERIAEDIPDENAIVHLIRDDELALDSDESGGVERGKSNYSSVGGNVTELEWGLGVDGSMLTDQSAVLTLGSFKQRLVTAFTI